MQKLFGTGCETNPLVAVAASASAVEKEGRKERGSKAWPLISRRRRRISVVVARITIEIDSNVL